MRFSFFILLLAMACATKPETKTPVNPATTTITDAVGAGIGTSKLPLEKLKLPAGFKISIYAENVENARSMCLTPGGTVFVGTRSAGKVFALRDNNGDGVADQQFLIAKGLNMPNGVAFRNGSLYVAEVSRILRFDDIESKLANPPAPTVVYDKYPTDEHHGWKFIAFGPDGKLYVPVGAPCNICEPENPVYCSITRLNADGTGMEVVQRGVRNTVGFGWHPVTKELWFTDNGRDMMGDEMPNCELNRATADGQHFGYPYCHQGDTPDPKFNKRPCTDFVQPAAKMGPHVAPLGFEFCTATSKWPAAWHNTVIVALHGSWNRSKKSGYNLTLVRLDPQSKVISTEPFITGWLEADENVWGRPVDLEWMPDGSLLVSDDYADVIYRITKA
jgi:glucose/arabinose dehydrogenase